MTLVQRIETAWGESGVKAALRENTRLQGRLLVRVSGAERERAFVIAIRALEEAGCRTCAERDSKVWSVYGFSETESICIDLTNRSQRRGSFFGRPAPRLAVLGPDGVGKSTALKLACQWFERYAPFVNVTRRQWRPGLLPPLAALLGRGGGEGEESDQRPRRNRGNLQWVRLFYYFLDFLFGAWRKDRNHGGGSRLIVYDRCALDMCVDPYRFALSSKTGTRLLWKVTPRPQTLILLYDDPERIAARKDDLQMHEVAEQLDRWLTLAGQDEVHAVVRVDGPAEEIAARIRDLMIDAFVRHTGRVSAATAAPLPIPSGTAENSCEYAVLPSASNPRFLVPLANRKAAAASMSIYHAQRPVARLAKRILTWGLRSGLAQPFLRHRVRLDQETVASILGSAVGYENVSFAISRGTPGPNQKPALQVMDHDGRVLGYAKIGWNQRTVRSIRNEEEALRRLEVERFPTAIIPFVQQAREFLSEKSYILVQSTETELRPGATVQPDNRHVQFLAGLHDLRPDFGALPTAGLDATVRLRRGGFHYYAHLIEWSREYCAHFARVPFGPMHGDFTPWNIRASAGGKLLVFDWETFESHAPAAWDLFHLIVAGEVEVRGTKPGAIFDSIATPGPVRELIEDYFDRIGANTDLIEPLFVSYLAHSLCAGVLDLGADASDKDCQLQRTWAALLMLMRYRGRVFDHVDVTEEVAEVV